MCYWFPCNYFAKTSPDDFYEEERDIVAGLGSSWGCLDFDDILAGKDPFAGKDALEDDTLCVWRGWQMPSDVYATFYEHAAAHGWRLLNSPDAYASMHELSGSYPLIASEDVISTTIIELEKTNAGVARQAFEKLGAGMLFVKDTVKGAYDPCILEASWTDGEIERELARLVADRGDAFTGKLAFKEFRRLSGETRFFVLNGDIVGTGAHFSADADVSVEEAAAILDRSSLGTSGSRFFTLDVSCDVDSGRTVVVETGDGQVSDIPDECREAVLASLSNLDGEMRTNG